MRIADEIGVDSLRYLPDGLVMQLKANPSGMNIVRHALRLSISPSQFLQMKKKRRVGLNLASVKTICL